MKKQTTNVEFVTELMEFSDYGALAQLFVIDALTKWSEKVMNSRVSDYPEKGLVNPKAWIGVACEINEKLVARYEAVIQATANNRSGT